jgi:hypothetical protein
MRLDGQGHLVGDRAGDDHDVGLPGENRMTSAPNREMSKRLAPVAINSMAQQARPIGMGQREFLRHQLKAAWLRNRGT